MAGGRGLAEARGRGQAQVSGQGAGGGALGRGHTRGHPGTAVKQVIHGPGHGMMQILVDSPEYSIVSRRIDLDPEPDLTLLLIDCAVTLRWG